MKLPYLALLGAVTVVLPACSPQEQPALSASASQPVYNGRTLGFSTHEALVLVSKSYPALAMNAPTTTVIGDGTSCDARKADGASLLICGAPKGATEVSLFIDEPDFDEGQFLKPATDTFAYLGNRAHHGSGPIEWVALPGTKSPTEADKKAAEKLRGEPCLDTVDRKRLFAEMRSDNGLPGIGYSDRIFMSFCGELVQVTKDEKQIRLQYNILNQPG